MTDLDSTEIIANDESFTENPPTTDTKASLSILNGTDPQLFQINKETIIGRSNPSDFIIAAPSLSKQHAKITINNGQYFITDLGSSNKTFHNKTQLQPNVCYALHDGDEVKFGEINCLFQEEKQINSKVDSQATVNPSTQTISNSYENQEPIQAIKIWSQNNNEMKTSKQNGIDDSPNKSSSSFTPFSSSAGTNDIDIDDNNLIIGSTPLPASVPLIIESKELNNDDQLEIISSSQTKKILSNDSIVPTEIEDTPPPSNGLATIENAQQLEMETSTPLKPLDNPDEQMDNSTPKLNEEVEESNNITDDTPIKQQNEGTTNQEIVKQIQPEEEMDTEQTTESPSMVIDDKQQQQQQDNTDEMEEEVLPTLNADAMTVDETEKPNIENAPVTMEQETTSEVNKSLETPSIEPVTKIDESTATVPSEAEVNEQEEEEEVEAEEAEEAEESGPVTGRGVARRNVRRARGRRRGTAARARVVSTRILGGRRNPVVPPTTSNEENNKTLEETVNTEPEESPEKPVSAPVVKEKKPRKNETSTPNQESNQTDAGSNVRVSARIKDRISTGRNRQFPYADDYVDLDVLEKQAKTNAATTATPPPTTTAAAAAVTTTTTATPTGRKSNRGRASASPQKRISLRQQPIDASENSEEKDKTDIYEQMDTVVENQEPTPKTGGRKRKSTTPVSAVATKRNRPATPQSVPTVNTRRKQTSPVEVSPVVAKSTRRTTGGQKQAAPQPPPPSPPPPAVTTATTTTPKRGRKSTKLATSTEQSPEKQNSTADRPVRIALSSHLNFDQHHFDILRNLGFEIMDESCQVDALVVDRIRRTKKFFMCLARGALILSPAWIEIMIKENRYIPYEKYFLKDTNAETRYGFELRESVRLAKQGPIFENRKFFCTKDTSPPYDDLKDIIEAAGGKLVEKINMNKPGKDIICIVAQVHKNDYEDLFKKNVSIVSEEFILSGISKQKLDFDAYVI
ncbi:unnamed protein product [Adineta steineri]|uniref:Mediator of DNA damage checkpoint protein 1 n=1 Tax=Adineta steineri TaxID=433720 RepID=A0A815TFN0_9BILA|nr:unnamed protein product [Adineta steineri]CAF1504620.1 unnamed protein product [Adineta steineri]